MRTSLALLTLLAGASACGPDLPPAAVPAAARHFSTGGCGASRRLPARAWRAAPLARTWAPPERPMVRLHVAETVGASSSRSHALATWEGDALSEWARDARDGVTFTSPLLPPSLSTATALRVVLRPGASTTVQVVASPEQVVSDRVAALRGVVFSLDQGAGDEVVTLEARLDDALRGNWGDDGKRTAPLVRAQLRFPEPGAVPPTLVRVEVLGPEAVFGGEAAGERGVALHEVRHPAWFASAGTTASATVRVPEGRSVLRWYDGAVGATEREVRVTATSGTTHLRGRAGGRWRARGLDLTPFAGAEVEVSLEAVSGGVALMGLPRVVRLDAPDAAPNVVVVLLDTLRADHVGVWGAPSVGVSPTLDRLASEGVMFSLAQSTSPWTKPAIPTLMTGLWPTTHGVGGAAYTDKLPVGVPTLASQLSAAGWRTGSFSASPLGSTLSGLARDFDTALPPTAWRGHLGPLGHVSADQVIDAALDWVDESPDVPFFAYLHTLEVHGWRRAPYAHPPDGWTSYDAALFDLDAKLGTLISALEARGIADNTLVVVVSDHGESFGDHGLSAHGTGLVQSQIHVPLVFWAGESLPSVGVPDPVSLADVAPTVLDLVGVTAAPTDGASLRPYVEGPVAEPLHDGVFSARLRYVWAPDAPKKYAWTRADGVKILRVGGRDRTFDLSVDLCEGASEPYVSRSMQQTLTAWLTDQSAAAARFRQTYGDADAGALQGDDVAALRSLGYVE